MERIFWWNRISLVADRPYGASESGARNRTFLKPCPRVVSNLSGPMRFRVRIRVDAWNTNDDVISPPTSWATTELRWFFSFIFYLYYFCSFNYSPLINLITNSTLKSISAQFKFLAEAAPLMGLECVPQRFYSSMRFRYESIFTEIFLNRIKWNWIVFGRFGSMWTGPEFSLGAL